MIMHADDVGDDDVLMRMHMMRMITCLVNMMMMSMCMLVMCCR